MSEELKFMGEFNGCHTYAKVIADSVSPEGKRVTTMEVKFHRFVLAEFNTHRAFSRNGASSRAIPLRKMLDRVKDEAAMPIVWASEQPGMQGGNELDGFDVLDAMNLFCKVYNYTLDSIDEYVARHDDPSTRLHKSLINRLLEPFMYQTMIVTATDFQNFFDQRCSPLAQPEIRVPAEMMQEAYKASTPTPLYYGEWHLPYVTGRPEVETLDLDTKLAISAARCARVSYLNHDGQISVNDDIKLWTRLIEADPPHFSPFEHQATPKVEWSRGNLDGWMQYRHVLEMRRK